MQRAKRLSLIPPYLFGEIAKLKAQAIAEGRDLIDLGIGDPDQPTPPEIIDHLAAYSHDPTTHRYDESNMGRAEFLEDVATWFQNRFGVTLDPTNEILELIGSKEGLAHAAWAFIDPGDVALVPDPAYTVVKVNTLLVGGTPYEFPLLAENGFLPDFTQIPGDVVKKAKLIYLNYPNNPTGAVATKEFFQDAVNFARETDTLILHDCAYSEAGFDGYQAPSIMQIDGAKEVAIETHSLSKTFNMTGWRIGFAVGSPDALRALNTIKGNVDSKQFAAVALTAGWALNHARNDDALALLQRRRDVLVDGLNRLGWSLEKPKATFYIWAPVPPGYTSATFSRELLEKADVLAIPGLGYGPHGDGYVRMSLTVSGDQNGEKLEEAVHRIEKNVVLDWSGAETALPFWATRRGKPPMITPPSPFRYFRDPHHFSSYNEAGEHCPFCGLVRPGYGGGFFGLDNDGYDFICEICLLEGRLTEKNFTTNEGESLQPEIRLRHPELSETEVEALVQARTAELEQQTPQVETWQGILWPAHCGDFCCFLKEAGQLDMQRLAPDGDGRRFFEDHMSERQEDVWEAVRPDAPVDNSAAYSVGVYLFQCLECGEYVITWDCD